MLIDERRKLVVPGDREATLTFCVEHFLRSARTAIQNHGRFFVALSGGSTPKAIFQKLTTPPYVSQIDWAHVELFWSDERSVPPEHPDSNYHMAMESGFNTVPVPPTQVHRMHAEIAIQQNAEAYEKTIRHILGAHPFDLVMLGMGEDGHTASLFPNTEALHAKNRLVVPNFVPQKNSWRMTLTLECINAASQIVFYVIGASKKEMLAKVLAKGASYPASLAGTPTHPALWIVDEAASVNH